MPECSSETTTGRRLSTSDIHEMLKKRFGEEVVFNTTIGRSVRMRDATVRGQTIFELPEAQAQAQQFLTLIHEMLNRGSKTKGPDAESASG